MTTDRALLFLDFDGVMHPAGCDIDQYFCHQPLLEGWLRQRPRIDLVISSSWRAHHPLDEMHSYFSDDVAARILGTTPVIRRSDWAEMDGELLPVRFEREAEVTRWLHENNAAWQPWAALDDQSWLYKPFNPRVVLCDGSVGLTQRQLHQVDQVPGLGK